MWRKRILELGRVDQAFALFGRQAAHAADGAVEGLAAVGWQLFELLEYLSRYKRDVPLPAVVLDAKGNVELEDYYLRAKVVSGTNASPGETIHVQIETIDPSKGDVRLKVV